LERALGGARRSIQAFAVAGAAAIGAASGALVVMTGRALQNIDAQAKLARAVGGTTAAMQGLQRAADRAGVQHSELAAAATRLNQRLGQVIATGEGAEDTFAALGMTAQELSAMDIDERFAAIADAMNAAGMSSQEMSFHLRELGIRQSSVITLIQGGGDAIRRSRDMVEEFGVAVSEVDAAAIERANDAMQEVGRVFEGLANQMAVRIAPFLEQFSNSFTAMAQEGGPLRDALDQIVDSTGRLMEVLSDPSVIQGFTSALTGLLNGARGLANGLAWVVENTELVTAAAVGAATAIALAGGPLSALVTAAGIAVAGVLTLIGRIRETFGSVGDLFSMLGDVVNEAFDRIRTRVVAWKTDMAAASETVRGQFLGVVEAIASGVSSAIGAVASGAESILNSAITAVAAFVNTFVEGINLMIRGVNTLGAGLAEISLFAPGGVDFSGSTNGIDAMTERFAGLREEADANAETFGELADLLTTMSGQPLESLEALRTAMRGPIQLENDPAADTEDTTTRIPIPGFPLPGDVPSGDGDGGGGSVADAFAERLEALMEGLQTEAETVQLWYEEQRQVLEDALAQRLITEEEYLEARTRLEEEYARRSNQIESMRNQNNFAAVSGGINDILSAAASGNDKIMRIQKAFAAGMAWIDTLQGAARMLRAGTFGFAAAAAVIAKGIGFVSAIQGTSSRSRGAASGGGGSSAQTQVRELPTQTVRVDFGGQQSPMGMREMFDMINAGYDNGYRLRFIEA
jgi:hypothetical protein